MNGLNMPYTITDNAIVLYINGRTLTVNKNDTRFAAVKNAIRTEQYSTITKLLDLKGTLISESGGGLYLLNGILYCDKYSVPTSLGTRILVMIKEGFNISPLIKFLENLWSNPGLINPTANSMSVVDEIYAFVEACSLPITSDGCILAYKMVTKDFKDLYTETIDNSVGSRVVMDRNEVDSNRSSACSTGLHFCSQKYLGFGYASEDSALVVVVKINPRDIVSIPSDYENAKGRACEYEVVDTIRWDDLITPLFTPEYSAPEIARTKPDSSRSSSLRWEVRDSNNGDLLNAYASRQEARDYHRSTLTDTFIWDTYTNTVTGGSVSDDLNLNDLPPTNVGDEHKPDVVDEDTTVAVNPGAKLNEDVVREIRSILMYEMNDEDYTIVGLAREYGVSERTIRRIRDYESWVHVTELYPYPQP